MTFSMTTRSWQRKTTAPRSSIWNSSLISTGLNLPLNWYHELPRKQSMTKKGIGLNDQMSFHLFLITIDHYLQPPRCDIPIMNRKRIRACLR